MTADEFNTAKTRLGDLSNRQMATALGLARNTVNRYAAGETPIPRCVELACAALVHGLAPVMPVVDTDHMTEAEFERWAKKREKA